MASSFISSSNSRSAASYFQERAEDAADALRDLIGRSTGGLAGAGSSSGGRGAAAAFGGGTSSSRYLDIAEEKVALIGAQINATSTDVQLDGLRRIVAVRMISIGRDASSFLPGALKLTSSSSLEVRKLVYIIILTYARSSVEAEDLTLLSINSFQRDSMDSSPLIRGMAIRVLTGLRNPLVHAVVEMSVRRAARDSSAYVRKITALALPRCVDFYPSTFDSHLQSLATLLGDRSPQVIGAALVAFQRIFRQPLQLHKEDDHGANHTAQSGGASSSSSSQLSQRWELIHPHFRRMCHALADMNEWSQIMACEVLLHYARECFEMPVDMAAEVERRDAESQEKQALKGNRPDRRRCEPDLSLLVHKSRMLFASRNPAVVLAAARLHYYLLPSSSVSQAQKPHVQAPLVNALLALISPGRAEDRDTVLVALYNILWLLNGGSARPLDPVDMFSANPSSHTQDNDLRARKRREQAKTYQKLFAPYVTAFLPRSDCARSKLAPGSLPLALLATSSYSSSGPGLSGFGLGSSSGNGAGGLLEVATSTVAAAAAVSSSATSSAIATSTSSSTLMATTTLASSTATSAIFHLKLAVLARLARPENARYLIEELEEIARWEYKDDRAERALDVLCEVLDRLAAKELGRQEAQERIQGQGPAGETDRLGIEARLTELALSILSDVSSARWTVSAQGGARGNHRQQRGEQRRKEDREHPMPVRARVIIGAVKLLVTVLKVKGKALQTLLRRTKKEPLVAPPEANKAPGTGDNKERGKEVEKDVGKPKAGSDGGISQAAAELQLDMFDILQRAADLLYTSGDAPAPARQRPDTASPTPPVQPTRKLKLVGKRNVTGAHERHALFWALGEFCRIIVEVDWTDAEVEGQAETEARPKKGAQSTKVVWKSAAELLGVDVLRKASGHFGKEPARAKLAIITLAAKVWAFLQTRETVCEPGTNEEVTRYAESILQQASRDANLDLQAHARRYLAMMVAITASSSSGGESEEETSAPATMIPQLAPTPGDLIKVLFVADAEQVLLKSQSSDSSSYPALVAASSVNDIVYGGIDEEEEAEFGSLALALGSRRLGDIRSARIPKWAAPGTGIASSKRDPPSLVPDKEEFASGSKVFVSSLGGTRPNCTPAVPLRSASAYDYVVEGEGEELPRAAKIGNTPSLVPTATVAASSAYSSRAASPFAQSTVSARPMNPKYQDLDSFLDEEVAEPPIVQLPLAPSAQFESLSILQQPAPQDEEYRDEYDEDDFEEVEDEPNANEVAFASSHYTLSDGRQYRGEPEPDSDDYEEEDAGQSRSIATHALLPEEDNAWAS
ncbi:ARM repeat-containing protein [Tilletiaria anomala UBC 951]|uniref:ARM repeat-containing protein n=1 Tax=Tilletiaria anomala (strain ATCC 24038 / CBS 436.72 / UBC 951) TaxID=1037660 RepID=A0A066VLZ8_TILAU|nr:ARM repeat-containing protein [Tilletiaria anomala UBC 951]KDN39615.1 ARM repeat-containing protein [Tilletiaria anomala UBC 951]